MQKNHTPKDIIRAAGLRSTAGRIEIVKTLLRADSPLSQEQIASQIGRRGLNKVSIYRALESFIEAGLIHKVHLAGRTWLFELAHNCTHTQCHPHFTCTNCGATRCMTGATVPLADGIEQGFIVHRQSVQLEGLCPECSKK
jgi:Fur family ferric uptake transcriptional regulator